MYSNRALSLTLLRINTMAKPHTTWRILKGPEKNNKLGNHIVVFLKNPHSPFFDYNTQGG